MGLVVFRKRRAEGRSVDQHGCVCVAVRGVGISEYHLATVMATAFDAHTYVYSTERYRIDAGCPIDGSVALPVLRRLLDFCPLGLKRSSRSTWGWGL